MATIVLVLMIVGLLSVFALDIRQKDRAHIPETNKRSNHPPE